MMLFGSSVFCAYRFVEIGLGWFLIDKNLAPADNRTNGNEPDNA
jgi:hypothetical protein